MEDKFLRETLTTDTRNAYTRCTDLDQGLSLQKGFETQKKERNKAADLTGHCAKKEKKRQMHWRQLELFVLSLFNGELATKNNKTKTKTTTTTTLTTKVGSFATRFLYE